MNLKRSQNEPNMLPSMILTCSQNEHKNAPNMSQKQSQNDPNMLTTFSLNRLKMLQKCC